MFSFLLKNTDQRQQKLQIIIIIIETLKEAFMGFFGKEMILGVMGISIVIWVLRFLEWAWWRPWRLGRALRAQGLKGPSYTFLFGGLKESARMNKEARSKPIPTHSHNIIPRVAPMLLQTMNQNGRISFTWFGPSPRVTLTDPELIREVLSNKFGHFQKTKISAIGRWLASGLATYEGEKWAKHRRLINPVFHVEKLKRMLPAFSTCCDELISRWQTLVGPKRVSEIDVWPEFRNFTGDVISRTAFGSSYKEGRRIFQLQTEQAELLIQSFQYLHIPGYRFLPTRPNKIMKANDREIRELLRGIIEKRENAMRKGVANNEDLLGVLLESNWNEELGKSPNMRMSTEDVIQECKLFYFAGAETTSVLLTWTMVVLSMHPSWQTRARDEVLEVFGKDKPDVDGLSRLKIVPMILNEVLRLYPPVIAVSRQTYKAMELGGITYPAGVTLTLPIIFVHHAPEYWGEDALEFKPERFANGISKAAKDQVAFFPFSWGPRVCIGQSFAMMEAKMGLSMILQHFEFELSPSYSHAPVTTISLHPEHGAQIMLHKI